MSSVLVSPVRSPGVPNVAGPSAARGPRVLFVGRSIGHFSYYESVLTGLLDGHADVELLLDRHWSEKWIQGIDTRALDEFRAERPELKVEWLLRRSDKWRNILFALRELRSYRSYL